MNLKRLKDYHFYLYSVSDNNFVRLVDQLGIGRDLSDVNFENEPSMSGKHCKFRMENGQPCIMDVGSKNGTTVNNVDVESNVLVQLDNLTEINMGDKEFVFVIVKQNMVNISIPVRRKNKEVHFVVKEMNVINQVETPKEGLITSKPQQVPMSIEGQISDVKKMQELCRGEILKLKQELVSHEEKTVEELEALEKEMQLMLAAVKCRKEELLEESNEKEEIIKAEISKKESHFKNLETELDRLASKVDMEDDDEMTKTDIVSNG